MFRLLRIAFLQHRRRVMRDELDTLRGQEAYARRKLAQTILTIRNRETLIARCERDIASLRKPHEIVREAVGQVSR